MADRKRKSSPSSQSKKDPLGFLSRVPRRKRSPQPLNPGTNLNASNDFQIIQYEEKHHIYTADEKYAADALVMLSGDTHHKRAKLEIKNKDDDVNVRFSLQVKSVMSHKLPSMDERDAKNPLFLPRGKTEQNPRNNSEFWKIKKVLYESDVNSNNRLMLGSEVVKNYILSSMEPGMAKNCTTSTGQKFQVYDVDDKSTHYLTLKKHTKSSKSFVLINKWSTKFVKRRDLGVGDQIGLAYDDERCRFLFKLLNRRVRKLIKKNRIYEI